MSVRLADVFDLVPVDRGEFFEEVGPCLTLAAGVGMSQADQYAWLEAAMIALDGIPIALLRRGVRAAMLKADHPSKIVPAISAEIGEAWGWRRRNRPARTCPVEPVAPVERQIERPVTEAEADEVNAILARAGAATRYRADGSRFMADTVETRRDNPRPRRKPTRQDYIDLGVDPATLDEIDASRPAAVGG